MKNETDKTNKKGLRPGEIKILKSLADKPLTNKEIGEATGLLHQPNLLINYLRRLQKIGLVERDIDNRKYFIKSKILSVETLYFNDIAQFIQNQIKKSINDQKEKNQEFFYDYWTGDLFGFATVENNSAFLKKLNSVLNEPENKQALRTVAKIFLTEWRAFVLALKVFSENERKTISQMEKSLSELFAIIYNNLSERDKERFDDDAIMFSEKGLKINHDSLSMLSESEKKHVNEIVVFLSDKKNLHIYEKYVNKAKEAPKTLLVYSLLGYAFRGYKNYKKQIDSLTPFISKLNVADH